MRKDKSIASTHATLTSTQSSLLVVQRDLDALHLMNASLAQCLTECSIARLMATSESFENVLQQVKHFHHPLHILREQIQTDQMLKDGKVVSL